MDLGLRGRKALVTGATRGIGRAVAETLAREGADVAICARDAAQVAQAVAALQAHGTRAAGAAVDVADGAALRGWVEAMAEALGGIDVLVCNPSGGAAQDVEGSWRQHFEVDVMGAVRAIEAAKPFLAQAAAARGDAAVVLVSSVAAAQAEQEGSYGAMKAALIHLAKGVSRQQAARRIRVNTVSPGTIYIEHGYWDMVRQKAPALYQEYLQRNPMGRMGSAQDVANAIAFLASPAASFISGANLLVDGAFTTRVNF